MRKHTETHPRCATHLMEFGHRSRRDPPDAYEVPMRSTIYTRNMFSVACGTTQPATQPTQPQPNQPERERGAEIRHKAHVVVMCSVNRKTLVSSEVLVGLAHHPPSHPTTPTHSPASQKEREAQKYDTGRTWWSCVRSTAKLGTLQIAHLPRLSHPNPSCRQPMPPKQSTEKVLVRTWEAS